MKTQPIFSYLFTFALLLGLVWSCKKVDTAVTPTPTPTPAPTPVTKSAAKDITKFSFTALNPAVDATIDATAKTISATVPAATDVTKLVPTITLSDKATVSPATGVAQDFSKEVSYTVTAEDASTVVYKVSVKKEAVVVVNTLNDIVFAGCADKNLYALDAQTGNKVWSSLFTDSFNTTEITAFNNGILYFVNSGDKTLYAVEYKTGKAKWSYKNDDVGFVGPTFSNGVIYCTGLRKMLAIDAEIGTKKWEFISSKTATAGVLTVPTISNGVVYFGSSADSKVYAIDANTGISKWEFSAGDRVQSNPCVANGTVYVGTQGKKVFALDAATGKEKWQYSSTRFVYYPSTYFDGKLYLTDGTDLIAFDGETGQIKWTYKGASLSACPQINNGLVYCGDGSKLLAIDAQTGLKKWEFNAQGNLLASPTIANGIVYAGAQSGKFYAIDAQNGNKKWEFTGGASFNGAILAVDKDGKSYFSGDSGMQQ